MELIPEAEVERLMRVRHVMLQAMSKKLTWWPAAEILGVHHRLGLVDDDAVPKVAIVVGAELRVGKRR